MRCLTSVHTIAHSSLRSGLKVIQRESRVAVQYLMWLIQGVQIVVSLGLLQDSPV